MRTQVVSLGERTSAAFPWADKGFRSCVDTPVPYQLSRPREYTSTAITRTDKELCSGVSAQVLHHDTFFQSHCSRLSRTPAKLLKRTDGGRIPGQTCCVRAGRPLAAAVDAGTNTGFPGALVPAHLSQEVCPLAA